MEPRFTVVIATAGRPTLLNSTLRSLSECRLPSGYAETVVVENGAKGLAEEIVGRHRSKLAARYVHVPEPGKNNALNMALATIGDGLVYFTDDDVRFSANTLQAYAEAACSRTSRAYFGGPTGADYESSPPDWLIPYLPRSARGHSYAGAAESNRLWFLGFNWAAFAQDIVAAGGFDLAVGPGSVSGSTGDERDMQARLADRGCAAVYVPDAMVWHHVPPERCDAKFALNRAYREGIFVGLKHIGSLPPIAGVDIAMVGGLLLRGWRVATATLKGQRRRFESRRWIMHYLGAMRGYRIACGMRRLDGGPQQLDDRR